ncbi:hypothetical protein NADFUDRAFT_76783 [Nadsonia fulvescens var. elongata DSM 6958]|uniref:Uncharacterized protein n=1 Tax=Nadsonia fulvescens var. elongata DSM 6958 TaxID=857566 RepID=A0A1E3PU56_9ASCO|nr:hypothetical protein NADFUDRAFT_76783 [Nadsonia fulvescens var. elongata DSM 6958]
MDPNQSLRGPYQEMLNSTNTIPMNPAMNTGMNPNHSISPHPPATGPAPGTTGHGDNGHSSIPGGANMTLTPLQALNVLRQRVSIVLEINKHLIRHAIASNPYSSPNLTLVEAPPSTTPTPTPDGQPANTRKNNPVSGPQLLTIPYQPNPLAFQACMKRLSANLSYLASVADKTNKVAKSNPPDEHSEGIDMATFQSTGFPAVMSSPKEIPALVEIYKQLQVSFPELLAFLQQQAQAQQAQAQQAQAQQAQQVQRNQRLQHDSNAANSVLGNFSASMSSPLGIMDSASPNTTMIANHL